MGVDMADVMLSPLTYKALGQFAGAMSQNPYHIANQLAPGAVDNAEAALMQYEAQRQKEKEEELDDSTGETIGKVGGTIIGAVLGGPAGAAIGYQAGGSIGGGTEAMIEGRWQEGLGDLTMGGMNVYGGYEDGAFSKGNHPVAGGSVKSTGGPTTGAEGLSLSPPTVEPYAETPAIKQAMATPAPSPAPGSSGGITTGLEGLTLAGPGGPAPSPAPGATQKAMAMGMPSPSMGAPSALAAMGQPSGNPGASGFQQPGLPMGPQMRGPAQTQGGAQPQMTNSLFRPVAMNPQARVNQPGGGYGFVKPNLPLTQRLNPMYRLGIGPRHGRRGQSQNQNTQQGRTPYGLYPPY